MVTINVEIDDWDLGTSIYVTLPCNLKSYVDTSHELQVVECEDSVSIGYCGDVEKLNNTIEQINNENPAMTNEILISMLDCVGASLDDYGVADRLAEGDFMLEKIPSNFQDTDGGRCAYYLATHLHIPFAKNITTSKMETMKKDRWQVNWNTVWEYYRHMGFKSIRADGFLYVFNWEKSR